MSMASSTTTDQETTAAASPEQLSVSDDDSPEFVKTVQQAVRTSNFKFV
jgi:hypothetical protein